MKIFLSKSFLPFFLVIFTIVLSFGQKKGNAPILTLGTATVDGDGGGDLIIRYDLVGCEMNVIFRVRLSNLHAFEPEDIIIDDTLLVDYFPEGTNHPDMYIEYYVADGPVERVLLTEFQLNEDNGLYEVLIESYTVNLLDECFLLSADEEFFTLDYAARLVTPRDDGFGNITYAPYPVCDFIGQGDIFAYLNSSFITGSTNAMNNISNISDIKQPKNRPTGSSTSRTGDDGGIDCTEGLPSPWILNIYCDGCIASELPTQETPNTDEGGNEGSGLTSPGTDLPAGDFRNTITELEQFSSKTFVYPNPFNNNLDIQWRGSDDLINIELYDVNGKLINSFEKNQLGNETTLSINTNTLAKGLYFLKIKSTNTTEMIKILKQ